MPYVKPGAEITQVEKSQSPVLITPELEAVIVGTAYHYQDPYLDSSKAATKLVVAATGTMTYSIADLGYSVADENQLIVDIVCTKGANVGRRFHMDAEDYTVASSVITIEKNISGVVYDTSVVFSTGDEFDVYIGFVAEKASALGHKIIETISDIEDYLGKPKTFNPLGYGTLVAMFNSGSKMNTFGHSRLPASTAKKVSDNLDELDLKDIYAIAGMDQDSVMTAYGTHVAAQSVSTAKHERIAFINPPRSTEIVEGLTSTTRGESAVDIQQANATLFNKRVFSIHPDRGYVLESRHVSTLKSGWIVASFASTSSGTIASGINDVPLLNGQIITSDGTKYPSGTKITAAIWNKLVADGWGEQGEVNVYVPVPGYYACAAAAGAVIGTPVEQPLTYFALGGIDRLYGSTDMFSEANLNTMAEGGTFILVQDSINGPVYVRHQLSTDVSTIERKELSITKQVDYAAKYMRKTLTKYAGKYNITPNFIKLVTANLNGVGNELVADGKLAAVKVLSVYQDSISPDTVRAEVEITVKYPANYIKIRLVV